MQNRTRSLFANRFVRIIALSIVGVSTALGCAWSMLTERSVRFNSMRTGRGFYRLPPLPVEYNPATGREYSTVEIEQYIDENPELERTATDALPDPDEMWKSALSAIEKSNIDLAVLHLKRFLDATQYKPYWESDEHRTYGQDHRNSATDLIDALGERKHGASTEAVVAYAKARLKTLDEPLSPVPVDEEPARSAALQDNWAYLNAAVLYNSDKKGEALTAFQEIDKRFPRSEKNEAVIYMIGKLLMEQGDACDDEACEVPAYESAIQQFKRSLRQYPNGRYALDARGWIAHIYNHQKRTPESLAEYYRLLGNTRDRQWRLNAKRSLQFLGHDYDDATLDEVEALISNEPDAALAYSYHRIYNHAIDLSYTEYNEWCCYGDTKWSQMEEEKERVKSTLYKGRHELERVAKFATAMVQRYGESRVSGDFLLRIAQAQLELQNFREALSFADRALRVGVIEDSRAEAYWVKGSSEHQLKRLVSANSTFAKLVAEFPAHKLTEGAKRLLAITKEDQGDFESALDIYFDLGYKQDVAYFVDVLLPTDRFARYVADRRSNSNHDILRYSLGLRYMREGRWQEARESLTMVATGAGHDDYLDSTREATWYYPKEPGYGEPEVKFIKKSWVMQDLRTIDVIEYRENRLKEVEGDEARAEAMYQLASAYFELDDLAFYNPAMWDGGRVDSLMSLQFSSDERLPNETRTIFEHLQVHDPWAKAIPLYEEIVAKYPESKVARDALYTIAVAHERLEGRNGVWNEVYKRGLFAGPRLVKYNDVRNTYPNYQLPRGTYGWEPSTRTVNGGPGWAAKPKAPPKLTTEQRVVRKLGRWKGEYGPWISTNASWAWGGVKSAAESVSNSVSFYLTSYFLVIYFGLLATPFWMHRRQLYHGPITKGAFLAHRGLMFAVGYVRRWLEDIAIPSVVHREAAKKELPPPD